MLAAHDWLPVILFRGYFFKNGQKTALPLSSIGKGVLPCLNRNHLVIPAFHKIYPAWLDDHIQMPDKTVSLLIQFLLQGNGSLSTRAHTKEFASLTPEEATAIETHFKLFFKVE
ncbi:hypothetical protein EFB08_07235 [Rufibacter latericius]|uniref:Uncharacterized protein n=2 Tax=Rufibacter latericius TaxID=2487040 RepID=A0A3M9MUL3_9BACT|nr:hypothetical protein EFB08_07235 [Rufibacter latericius]